MTNNNSDARNEHKDKDKDVKFQTTGVVSWPSIQVDHHFVCNVAVLINY